MPEKTTEKTPEQAEKSLFETLYDEKNSDVISLTGENGEVLHFEQIAIIPCFGRSYCILRPLDMPGVGENEGFVFQLVDDNDEEQLKLIVDETIIAEVFDRYGRLVDEANGE